MDAVLNGRLHARRVVVQASSLPAKADRRQRHAAGGVRAAEIFQGGRQRHNRPPLSVTTSHPSLFIRGNGLLTGGAALADGANFTAWNRDVEGRAGPCIRRHGQPLSFQRVRVRKRGDEAQRARCVDGCRGSFGGVGRAAFPRSISGMEIWGSITHGPCLEAGARAPLALNWKMPRAVPRTIGISPPVSNPLLPSLFPPCPLW